MTPSAAATSLAIPPTLQLQCLWDDWRASRASTPGTFALVSYPKAGVTWLKFLLAEIFISHFGLENRRSSVEIAALTREHPDLPRIDWDHDESAIIHESGFRPDPLRLFAYSKRLRYRGRDVILLVRDPRDIVVSYFHQVTRRAEQPMSFSSLSAFVRDPVFGIDRVVRFYRIWERNLRTPRRILLLRYEDLLAHGEEQLRLLLRFLGLDVSPAIVAGALQKGSADNLRALEKQGSVEGMRSFGAEPDAMKVRKARAGSYLEELSTEDIAFCSERLKHFPELYGYTFD